MAVSDFILSRSSCTKCLLLYGTEELVKEKAETKVFGGLCFSTKLGFHGGIASKTMKKSSFQFSLVNLMPLLRALEAGKII